MTSESTQDSRLGLKVMVVCPQRKFNRIQRQVSHYNNRGLPEELQAMAGLLEQACFAEGWYFVGD
jgi:hypothetical protein